MVSLGRTDSAKSFVEIRGVMRSGFRKEVGIIIMILVIPAMLLPDVA